MQDHLEMACAELKRTQETTRNLEEKVEVLQRQLEEKRSGDRGDENTKYIWRIDKFNETLAQAKESRLLPEKESFVFYTENYGYKLKILFNPNDNWNDLIFGPKEGLLASVFLMKGEYDAVLPWPFNRKVILTLIDQQQGKTRNLVRSFIPDQSFAEINRPNGVEMAEIGRLRISYEKLQTSHYIVDDTLFLQVEVSTP